MFKLRLNENLNNNKKEMSLHQKLRNIIYKKFPNIKLLDRIDTIDNFWIPTIDICKITETDDIPRVFTRTFVKNGNSYVSADNLISFLTISSNPHHTLDYLIPLDIEYRERPLLNVVRIFDKYGIRGKYNFDMSNVSGCLKFNVSYYYHSPYPMLVDVYSTDRDNLYDQTLKMFEMQKCRCLEIDTRNWSQMMETILYHVETHLLKLNALSFMAHVIKSSDEIKDIVDDLGEDLINSCCAGEEFPFSLSESLKKFRILKSSPKYKEIMEMFETNCENITVETKEVLNTLDENSDIDFESCEDDDKSVNSFGSDIVTQHNNNTLYVVGRDYVFLNDDYYLNHPTLIKIAIRSGVRKAEQYVDMTWRLINYINKYGKLAYTSLLQLMETTPDERKEMFTFSKNTYDQSILAKLNQAYLRIEELESFVDINKRKKEFESYAEMQRKICNKDQSISELKITSISDDIKITPNKESNNISENSKQPTKTKLGDLIKKSKGKSEDNELELFLGIES